MQLQATERGACDTSKQKLKPVAIDRHGLDPWRELRSWRAWSRMLEPAALDLLTDFLRASIHLILHTRRVYPSEIFERRRIFDITTWRSRHAELNEYIDRCAACARDLLHRVELDVLEVRLLGTPPGGRPHAVESYRFELHRVQEPSAPLESHALQSRLAAFIHRLHVCEALLDPLPAGLELSFEVRLHSEPGRTAEPLPQSVREQWVEADDACATAGRGAGGRGGGIAARVVPLKSHDLGEGVTMQLVVLQHARA